MATIGAFKPSCTGSAVMILTTRSLILAAATLLVASNLFADLHAAETESRARMRITLTSKGFDPAVLHVPADKRIEIMVDNTTSLPAEFESATMAVERMIPGRTQLPVYIRPLPRGTYVYFNDFTQNVSGKIIAQ